MATFTVNWELDNSTGHVNYKLYHRVAGTTLWYTLFTSGTSYALGGLTDNYIYDIQVQNINNLANDISLIMQGIGITDPMPLVSPTNSSIAYSFANLSYFMTSYTVTVALALAPGSILQTHEHSASSTVTGIFTGLVNSTAYILSITPVANQFSATFTYHVTTEESAACASSTGVYATLTSGAPAINVFWTAPAIPPPNYLIAYRRKGDDSYTSFITSGLTSGNTTIVPISALANYEGYVQNQCTSEVVSMNVPFGINSTYIPSVSVAIQANPLHYIATVTSLYPNPYDTLISGTFNSSVAGTVSFSCTYPASSTVAHLTLSNTPMSAIEVITNVVLTSTLGIFDNGDTLQQFDSVLTPSYFQFVTSGTVWNGNPVKLSSFTLDEFIPTEVAGASISGSVLAGILNVSWIYDHVYAGGTSPYNTVTLTVKDPANSSVMGTVTTDTGTLGVNRASIVLTKQVTDINTTNSFNMVAQWSDGTIINTVSFKLPLF